MGGKYLTPQEIGRIYKVSPAMVRRWNNEGKIRSIRTPGGHRRFLEDDILAFWGVEPDGAAPTRTRCAVYARVSTKKQSDMGDLDRQVKRLLAKAAEKSYHVVQQYDEVASGLNENRKGLRSLLTTVAARECDVVLVEYKDRLARFGFSYIEAFCSAFGVKIEESEMQVDNGAEEELVEDMISIVTCFSARLYGKRGGRVAKKMREVLESEVLASEDDG